MAMKKTRNTRQRAIILEILRATRSHPNAEAIYSAARAKQPNISLGTVYRNLGFLRERGLVNELRSGDAAGSRFEAVIPPHAHFHCVSCNAVYDIPLPAGVTDSAWIGDDVVGSVDSFELTVTGECSACFPARAEA
jgi:Fe2+ or Zn2+ uptake regulation protein